ncbi:acyltransferase family protein [Maricaulis sp. D1M11]|uniref:acyltransferase family protein n=1 Tax=Maricaulis sp. D1M11 TaxID=3076117 RepID=UPI0039B3FCBF
MSSTTPAEPSTPAGNASSRRRYDIDWLRIGAFGLLIFYHIGMFFNTEGWHAKSTSANTAMEPIMWLSSPWRLPLLFFISGIAIRYLSDKLGSGRFAVDRVWRLFPVILFGMYVIVAPQTYSELVQSGEVSSGFVEFYLGYAGTWDGPYSVHTPTWNHLWYVVYLFVYCLLLAPLIPVLRWLVDYRWMSEMTAWARRSRMGPVLILLLPTIPLFVIRFTLSNRFDTTHDLFNDWANHAISFGFVFWGYLIAKREALWELVDRARWLAVSVTLILFGFLLLSYQDWEVTASHEIWLWAARLARVVYTWSIILALLGLARRYLNHDGPVRRYLSEAIFPFYILHQTITVVTGFWIAPLGLNVWVEFVILVIATLGGCVLGFELVKRIAPLRPVMGLKWHR